MALGYTLVYGIIELINFAHGEVFMIGSFVSFGLYGTLGLTLATGTFGLVIGLFVILIVAMITSGALNVMIERVAYRPLRNAPKLAPLITAVGMSFILQNVGILWLGGSQKGIPDLINAQKAVIDISGVTVSRADILAVAVTIPLVFLLTTFVTRSRLGKAMRATAQDPEAARLMGINVDTTISLTFLLGGLLAGAAGLIYALYQTQVWFFQGFTAGLIAFTAAVMGGIGNLRGAVLGGLIIGVIQQISDNRIGNEWTPAVVFALPRADHGLPSPGPDRRADAGGRMTAIRELRKKPWADWLPAVVLFVAVALFPIFRPPLDGLVDDMIIALAYAVMALGLNIVVGFAGLLDLGYVAFYAFGSLAAGWFASDHFTGLGGEKGVHIGVSDFVSEPPRPALQLPADRDRSDRPLCDCGSDHRAAHPATARGLHRDRDARLRRDHRPLRPERRRGHDLRLRLLERPAVDLADRPDQLPARRRVRQRDQHQTLLLARPGRSCSSRCS